MDNKIDFVITYVNGGDEKWIAKKNKYLPPDNQVDARDKRYRDWDNLKYWFRAIENCMPWVRYIFFVSCGQVPSFLNLTNNKLKIIKYHIR